MRAAIATIFAAAVAAELDPFDVIPLTQLARRVGAADPEQIYVAVGNSSDSVVITWITSTSGTDTSVEYGPTSTFGSTATGTAGSYKIGSYTSGEIKTVHVTGLSPAQTYYYRVGGASGWSPMYSFTSNSVGPSFPYPLAVMGDPGQTTNSNSTFTHVASSKARSFLITGDLSYADGDQPRWDTFQRLIQPLATGMISGLVTGNHDEETSGGQSYVAYNARWTMPYLPEFASSTKSVFYSYEVGPVHVIVLASFVAFTASSPQYKFLQADLASIDRSKTPWVIAAAHAPWRTSNTAHTNDGQTMRELYEPILAAAKVPIVFFRHVHAYERTCPMIGTSCVDGGLTYITIGDGGNREGLYTKWLSQPAWSAYRLAQYGSGLLEVNNATHATWSWLRNADGPGKVYDSVTIANTWTA